MVYAVVEEAESRSSGWNAESVLCNQVLGSCRQQTLVDFILLPLISVVQSVYKMSMEESISLEETNKIRISLGLKPLTDDKAPAADKDKEAEDNWSKKREQERKDREAKWVSYSVLQSSTDGLSFYRKIQEGIAK